MKKVLGIALIIALAGLASCGVEEATINEEGAATGSVVVEEAPVVEETPVTEDDSATGSMVEEDTTMTEDDSASGAMMDDHSDEGHKMMDVEVKADAEAKMEK